MILPQVVHKPQVCGGLKMTEIPSCGFSRLLASLVEGGSYNATWRFWHLPFCQAHGCPLLASCFFGQFLNPLSTQANLIPFEPLALEFTLSVRVFALFIWVSGVHYAYNRSSMFTTFLLRKFPFSPLQFVCPISLKEVVRCLRKETDWSSIVSVLPKISSYTLSKECWLIQM